MATRKEIASVLKARGVNNRFRYRTIGFSDLARCEAHEVTILLDESNPLTLETFELVKSDLNKMKIICHME